MKNKTELNPDWRVELMNASLHLAALSSSFHHTGNIIVAEALLDVVEMIDSGSRSANAESFGNLNQLPLSIELECPMESK